MSNPNPPVIPAPGSIEQAINEARQASPNNSGLPLEVTLPTGQTYRGNTPQELLDEFKRAQIESSRKIDAQKAQLRDQEARIRELEAPTPSVSEAESAKKIQDRYTTWAQNPTEATRQDLADLLGVPADRVVEVMKRAITNSTVGSASEEFMQRYPSFPNNPQAAAVMNEKLRQRFGSGMEAATADNLELVYNEALREGRITANQMHVSGYENQNYAVPNLRGNSAPANPMNEVLQNFGSLNLEQMKQVIEKYSGMLPK